jgi:hypothetical protein
MGLSDEECIINSLSGSAFLTGNTLFVDLLSTSTNEKGTAVVGGFPVNDPETLTDIIVCGGYNEWHHQDLIAGKITEFMEKAKELYPNAQVSIGMIGCEIDPTKQSKIEALSTVTLNGYKGVDYYNGLPYRYLNNLECVLKMNPEYMIDGLDTNHPTQKGYEALARAICQAVNGGYVPGHSDYEVSLLSPNSNVTINSNSSKLQVTIDGNIAKLDCNILSVGFSTATDISSGEIEIATIDTADSLVSGNNSQIVVQCVACTTTGDYIMVTSNLRIANGKIYITPNNWGRILESKLIQSIELYGIQIISPTNCY